MIVILPLLFLDLDSPFSLFESSIITDDYFKTFSIERVLGFIFVDFLLLIKIMSQSNLYQIKC